MPWLNGEWSAPPRILLVGMMGSGKSAIGRSLASRTGWPFLDNDELVKRATGRTPRQLLAEGGEDAMRDAESEALRTGLEVEPPAIVGIAGGAPTQDANRRLIESGGFVVWLRAAPEILSRRAASGEHRPWLDRDPLDWFRRTTEEREALYAEVADIAIDTGSVTPEDAAGTILSALARSSQ